MSLLDHDDWRVKIEIHDETGIRHLIDEVRELEVVHDARQMLANRVAVTHDGQSVFAYATTRQAAGEARQALGKLIDDHGLEATFELTRWHHAEEKWENADLALPQTSEELATEREVLRNRERQETEALGFAAWEVRVELPDRPTAIAFGERLASEGHPCARRWRYLLIGAQSEADAAELADRIKNEAPEGAHVVTEGSLELAYAEMRGALFSFMRPHLEGTVGHRL